MTGTCTASTSCAPSTEPPPPGCTRPCTTTVHDYVPTSTTSTSSCAQPACQTGVARAWYPNVFGEFDGYNERFNTSFYKETRPDSQTIVADFNDIGDASFGTVRSYEYTAWVHTCQGGTFTFDITRADDIALAWFGDRACGDFQKDNNQSSTSYQGGPGQGKSFTTTIAPGEYYPVRLVYANAGGLAILDVNITGPEGMVEEGRNDYQFFPQPCDNSNGFVPLGTEQVEGKSCVVI